MVGNIDNDNNSNPKIIEIRNHYNNMSIFTSFKVFLSHPSEQRAQILSVGTDSIIKNFSKIEKNDWNYIKNCGFFYTALMYMSGLFGYYLNNNKDSIFNVKYKIDRFHLGRMLKQKRSIVFIYYLSLVSFVHFTLFVQKVGLRITEIELTKD